jgi:hypothetical protein
MVELRRQLFEVDEKEVAAGIAAARAAVELALAEAVPLARPWAR